MAKILKFFLIVLLTGCASKGHWKYSYMNTGTADYSSSKLVYAFPDPNNSIQFEIFRTETYCKGYLTVQSHPILSSQDDPKKALISLQIGDLSFSYLAIRHQGGQRVLLPEKALEQIIESLLKKENVTLETSGYTTKLDSEGFSSRYKQFQSPSKLPRLIQLPL